MGGGKIRGREEGVLWNEAKHSYIVGYITCIQINGN